MIDGKKGKLI